jgi:hypothetical protein
VQRITSASSTHHHPLSSNFQITPYSFRPIKMLVKLQKTPNGVEILVIEEV